MHRRTLLARSLVIGATALLGSAIAGCSSGNDTAGSTTTVVDRATTAPTDSERPTAPDGAPEAGDCIEPVTRTMANGLQLPELVDCGDPHGGEIVSVQTLPGGADAAYPAWGDRVDGADDAVARCTGDADGPGEIDTFTGRKDLVLTGEQASTTGVERAFAVSGLQPATFVPGPAAWSRGERWLACAVVLSSALKTPSSYNGTAKAALAEPGAVATQFAWCKLQASEGPDDFEAVACSEPHNFEQLATFSAAGPDVGDPGTSALTDLARELCGPLSSQASGGRSDQLDDWLAPAWTFPTPEQWATGDRSIRCYVATVDGTSTGSVGAGTATR